MMVSFVVNGRSQALDLPAEMTLADALRDRLGLLGCKIACDQGVCGACTVLVDDAPVAACSSFGFMAEGRRIVTIEGLPDDDPVRAAFLETGAVQCGFCTAGMILAAHALLRACPDPDEATIRAWLAGNICRCTGYRPIIAAVRRAARRP